MATPVNRLCETEEATIANGASLSGGVNLRGRVLCGVYMPAAWTAAGLSFQGSADGVTYYDIHAALGEVTATTAASVYASVDPTPFLGVNFLKVRSGTSAAAVNQLAERVLTLMTGSPDIR